MPLHVPGSLDGLLSLLAPCFSQPAFQTFRSLVCGFVGRVGEHTVTGMWQAARLAGRVHHSRAHDFFARRRWDPDELGLVLLDFLVTVLVKPDAPLYVAIDDTLFGRAGRKVWGAHYLHDGSQPAGQGRRTRWGNCWVKVGLVVELPCLGGRSVCLPVLFRLFRPRDDAHPSRRSQPELAREMTDLILARFPRRTVHLLFDGAYATKAWRELPERATITTRMRATAALYAPAPLPTGKRGRPALKGKRLPSLAKLAETLAFNAVKITAPDGRQRTAQVAELHCLWYGPIHTRPVKLLLVRDGDRTEGYDIAIASTDTNATAAELIARYAARWTIETSFQEAKANGVGQARNRVRRAVERTVPFGFLCQTLAIVWYQLYGDADRDVRARRRIAPWYPHKQTASYNDMLAALRRELIRAEFHSQAPRRTHSPQIAQLQSPPALTAA
ncbi:MAG TPA: transposase [Solirubrobacteraceae bacterium]|nr:transposase [Solirubrobacteraceae bacterium]